MTIFNTKEGDSAVYCCRIEVPGWFNDIKKNIRLQLRKGEHMKGRMLVEGEAQWLMGNRLGGRGRALAP